MSGVRRSRWAAIGAAVAVSLGGGGIFAVQAASSPASSVVTIDPVRILDTRADVGLPGPFVSAVSQKLKVTGSVPTSTGTLAPVPAGATGVLLNVTVVSPTADGFLSVRPGDATGAPSTSSLNFKAGDIVPNSVQVGLPTSGANAGMIDITYDAFGVAGPTTEVLIDVVGYTSTAKLDALQAEIDAAKAASATQQTQIDAAEATSATQQTQIDAKANIADVYTKAQIDASAANSMRAAGYVGPNGVQNCFSWACVGTWSSAQTGVGRYTVTIPAAAPGGDCLQPLVQLTPFGGPAMINMGAAFLTCDSGDYAFAVNTYNKDGAAADLGFFFSVQVQPTSLTLASLADSPQYEKCTVDEAGNASCE